MNAALTELAKTVPETPSHCGPEPKWAGVIRDELFPMPRRQLKARQVLDIIGARADQVLVRDHNSPNDRIFDDDDEVDLGDGNVLELRQKCEAVSRPCGFEPAKRAWVVDDRWEITITESISVSGLRGLLNIPDEAELFRDFESPHDQPISDDAVLKHSDGPVFRTECKSVTVKVNNQPVVFRRRQVTGAQVKQQAKSQGVAIELDFLLYRVEADGQLSPSIKDHEHVLLTDCAEFRCIAADDNS